VRTWVGWVAAVVLVALAFTGGPDALELTVPGMPGAAATAELTEQRGVQVRDDGIDLRHRSADQRAPSHVRLPALPPAPQTAAPAPVRSAVPVAHAAAPPGDRARRRPGVGACTPEALQIFRC
jgi:hypothetical protein